MAAYLAAVSQPRTNPTIRATKKEVVQHKEKEDAYTTVYDRRSLYETEARGSQRDTVWAQGM